MSQAAFGTIPTNLDAMLRRAASRLWVVAAGWSVARALTVVLGVILAMLLLDAALHFAAWVRVGLNGMLLATLLAGVGYVVWVLRAFRYEPRRAAVIVEQRLGITNSQLINAVQLSADAGAHHSPALVRATIDSGDELAGRVELSRIADTLPLKHAMRNLAIVVAAFLIVFISSPGIFYAGIPRYLAPSAYHPPFTTLSFDVQIQPERVLFGQRVTIQARVSGGNAPSQATVVFVDDNDKPAQRIAMSRAPVASLDAKRDASGSEAARFVLSIDRAEHTRRFYIESTGGQSKLHTLEVFPVPQFKQTSVRYDYPAYTGWPSDTRRLDSSGIRVLIGTDAVITITSNIRLSGGTLTFTPDAEDAEDPAKDPDPDPDPDAQNTPAPQRQTYDLTVAGDEPTTAQLTLPVRRDGSFSITLRAYDGTPSNRPLTGSVEVVPDARPRIDITDPPQSIVAPESHAVEVQIKADDDVGIRRLLLTRSVNGWGSATVPLTPEYASQDRVNANATYRFDLPALGVAPGDVITYFATAYDNRDQPNGPNQSADSAVHVIQIISTEEYLEYERTKYRIDDINDEFDDFTQQLNELAEQREQVLEEMKPLLDKLKNGEALSEQDKQRLAELQKQLDAFERQAAELRKQLEQRAQMPELYEFEKPYTEMLKKLAEDLKQQEAKAKQAREALKALEESANKPEGGEPSPGARKNATVALEAFEQQQAEGGGPPPFSPEMQQQLEQTKDQLRQLEMADRLAANLDQIAAIIEAQRGLEQRLSVFENKEELDAAEQLRARELGEEQQQLRKLLEQARQDMQEAAEEAQPLLPQMSASAKGLVKMIDDLAIARDMNDATRLAQAGEARTSHTAADSAADKLESLIAMCEDCQPKGQGMGEIDGPLRLTPEQRQQALQQMAQARGVPGTNPGSGSGYSQGGSRAPMAVRGPNARPDERGQRGRRNGRAGQATASEQDLAASESIDAGTAEERAATAGYITGVPQEYREDAEAYFRRMADENK